MYRSLSPESINSSAHNQQWLNLELQLAASTYHYNQPPSFSDVGRGPENSQTQSRSDSSVNSYAPSYGDVCYVRDNSHRVQSQANGFIDTNAPSYSDLGNVRENSHSLSETSDGFFDSNGPSYSDFVHVLDNSPNQSPINALVDDTCSFYNWPQKSPTDGFVDTDTLTYSDMDLDFQNLHIQKNDGFSFTTENALTDINFPTGGGYDDEGTSIYLGFEQRRQDSSFKDWPQESPIQSPISGLVDDTYSINDWSQKSPTGGFVNTDTPTYSDIHLDLQNLHIQMNDGFSFATENALTGINFQTGGGYDDDDTSMIYLY